MTDTGALPPITHRLRIDASPEVVWRYLTEPEHVARWLGCLRYEKKIDHVFYMQQDPDKRAADDIEGATHCRILALEEPGRFVFSWYLPGTPETEVEFALETDNGGTTVVLTHRGWDRFDAADIRQVRDALENGWKSFVLPQLRSVVEDSAG